MNQYEIESAFRSRHDCPNVRRGVNLLHALMRSVNEQSDGWAYWTAPSRAAAKLIALLETAGRVSYGTRGTITADQLKAAVTPIRRMVTVQKQRQAKYGNTFDFDVDAALAE